MAYVDFFALAVSMGAWGNSVDFAEALRTTAPAGEHDAIT
jgi:hypothetical protein